VEDVRLGPDGTVYVLGSQVYRVDASGSIGIVVPSAVLPGMDEIAIGADGGIYLSAYQPGNPYLTDQIYAVQNGVASLLAGNGGAACGVSGSDAGVGFARVGGLVMDTDGSLVVADINLGSPPALAVCTNLLKVAPDGTTTNLAGNGMRGDREGAGAQAEFSYPLRPAVDGLGNIFVSDVGNYSIRKIAPDGTTSTFAGNGAQGFGDGVGAVVEFGSPAGIAIDASGNLYVADTGNSCIRKITPQGVVSTVAGNGTPGSVNGTLGRGGTTEFDSPLGVAVTPDGSRIYVAEAGNCAVRVIEVDLQ
jgi:DNA-binding beta-propeller fold protein YncE